MRAVFASASVWTTWLIAVQVSAQVSAPSAKSISSSGSHSAAGAVSSLAARAEPSSSPVAEDDAPMGIWMRNFRVILENQFCEKDGYFRTCFHLRNSQCKSSVAKAWHECLARSPASKQDKVNAELAIKLGIDVGSCVALAYEVQEAKVKSSDSACQNAKPQTPAAKSEVNPAASAASSSH